MVKATTSSANPGTMSVDEQYRHDVNRWRRQRGRHCRVRCVPQTKPSRIWLRREGGAGGARAFAREVEAVDAHAPGGEAGIPGVIDDVGGDAVGADDDRVVAGAKDVPRDGGEDARAALVPLVGVGAEHARGDAVVDAIRVGLPAT